RYDLVNGVQTCSLPIYAIHRLRRFSQIEAGFISGNLRKSATSADKANAAESGCARLGSIPRRLCSGYSTDVQRSEHYGVLAVRQCDDHGMCDDRAVLGMFHAKDLARARVNLARHKRDGPKETANLF